MSMPVHVNFFIESPQQSDLICRVERQMPGQKLNTSPEAEALESKELIDSAADPQNHRCLCAEIVNSISCHP
jgi:hypothetical protein